MLIRATFCFDGTWLLSVLWGVISFEVRRVAIFVRLYRRGGIVVPPSVRGSREDTCRLCRSRFLSLVLWARCEGGAVREGFLCVVRYLWHG